MLNGDLLQCAFHLILFQRQLYQRKYFKRHHKWGVPIWVCAQENVRRYVATAVQELSPWFESEKPHQVTLVILNCDDQAVEKWQFLFAPTPEGLCPSEEELRHQLRSLIQQIFASTTILPILLGPHTFKILVADQNTGGTPMGWKVVQPNYDIAHETTGDMQVVAGAD